MTERNYQKICDKEGREKERRGEEKDAHECKMNSVTVTQNAERGLIRSYKCNL
jgi:hypothetical protein